MDTAVCRQILPFGSLLGGFEPPDGKQFSYVWPNLWPSVYNNNLFHDVKWSDCVDSSKGPVPESGNLAQ